MRRPPSASITRLAMYSRFLEEYMIVKGAQSTINSQQLANFLDINPHQIRKDLSYFGKFGKRGLGYRVKELYEEINRILGLQRSWNMCLCGLGNLGSALAVYNGFRRMHLNIVAIFDNDPKKIGTKVGDIVVSHPRFIQQKVKRLNIEIAIITVPQASAQSIANSLVDAGIRAILNFAPVRLNAPSYVKLRNVDLATELVSLTHFLTYFK